MLEDKLIEHFIEAEPPKDNLAWTRAPKWLAIKGISSHEIRTFSGQVERGTPLRGSSSVKVAASKSKILSFGKYRGKEIDWVRENDKGYYNWALENIPNFNK